MSLDVERYLAAVRKFNQLVSELSAKLDEISDVRDEALRASADLQRELGSTDQKLQDIASVVRQQVTMGLSKKAVRAEDTDEHIVSRRVS